MLCQQCQGAWTGPDGRCPRCGAISSWPSSAAPGGPAGPAGYPAYPPYGGGYAMPPPVRVPAGLAIALYVMLGVTGLFGLLSLAASAMEYSLFGRLEDDPGGVSLSEADAVDAFYGVTTVVSFLLLLATATVFIIWFHRVRANAEGLNPGWPHRHGRGWAIGAWFVPIANLWLPKRIIDDVWGASDPASPPPPPPGYGPPAFAPSNLVLGWWLTWVASGVVSAISNNMSWSTDVEDYSGMQTMYGVEIFGGMLSVAAAVLAILVIRKLTTMQGVRQAMTATASATGPQPGQQWGGYGYPR